MIPLPLPARRFRPRTRKARRIADEGPVSGGPTKRFAVPMCDNPCGTTVRFLFTLAYDSTRRDRVESSRWERHDVRRSSTHNGGKRNNFLLTRPPREHYAFLHNGAPRGPWGSAPR